MGVSVGGALIALLFAWKKFSQYQKAEVNETGIGKVMANKWYVDELYDKIIIQPLHSLATFFNQVVEKNVIDGLVNGVGKAVNYGSRQIRLLQSGLVGNYILLMVIGMLVLFIIQLFL
jgi:NADH-quinone oxidoreductase subunit L